MSEFLSNQIDETYCKVDQSKTKLDREVGYCLIRKLKEAKKKTEFETIVIQCEEYILGFTQRYTSLAPDVFFRKQQLLQQIYIKEGIGALGTTTCPQGAAETFIRFCDIKQKHNPKVNVAKDMSQSHLILFAAMSQP